MEKLNLLLTDGPSLVFCNFKTKDVVKKNKKPSPIKCEYSIEFNIDNETKEVLSLLSVKSESENIPFDFYLKSQARFRLGDLPNEIKDKESIEKRAIIEAIPYVFSFLKEMVADLTRKAYVKPFYLPPIDLKIENFEKVEE